MKKTLILIAVLLLTALLMTGCGETAEPEPAAATHDPDAVFVDPNEIKADYGDYGFSSKDFTFGVYDKMDDVTAAIGEPGGTFEAESCAYQGSDYFYYYSGFEITANDIGDVRLVTYINVIDDTVATPQGVKIGMAEADMMAAMGTTEAASSGVYRYSHGSSVLQILVKDGKVTAIEYFPEGETGE